MKLKKAQFNYFGFVHKKVIAHFEGDLSYVGTFTIKKLGRVAAVYHNAKPNRSKNHKDYLLLWIEDGIAIVSGLDAKDMELERYQLGKYCPECKEVIYSIHCHDYRECLCDRCMVDGGKDYFRTSVEGETVEIDLLTGKVNKL